VAMRYVAVEAGREGQVVAIGRDHRAAAALQQRLLQAQQTMERDYARTRDSEARYRLLFQVMSEGVVIVDASSRRVADCNPAAERLLDGDGGLTGKPFSRLFALQHNEDAVALLSAAQASPSGSAPMVRMQGGGQPLDVTATVFREGRSTLFLVRVSPAGAAPALSDRAGRDLTAALEQLPDSFVVTDAAMTILDQNMAFLDLARLPGPGQARGQSLARFLGRPGLERNLLLETLQKHGSARNFPTVLRAPRRIWANWWARSRSRKSCARRPIMWSACA
jgi:transcriptional regulator PpsR